MKINPIVASSLLFIAIAFCQETRSQSSRSQAPGENNRKMTPFHFQSYPGLPVLIKPFDNDLGDDIARVEKKYGIKLPQDYRRFLELTNGCQFRRALRWDIGHTVGDWGDSFDVTGFASWRRLDGGSRIATLLLRYGKEVEYVPIQNLGGEWNIWIGVRAPVHGEIRIGTLTRQYPNGLLAKSFDEFCRKLKPIQESADRYASSLHKAIDDSNVKEVQQLAVEKPNLINLVPTKPADLPALHLAIALDEPEIVRILLKHGADPNLRDQAGCRPILYGSGSPSALKALLESPNIDLNAGNYNEIPALFAWFDEQWHWPCKESIELLLNRGLSKTSKFRGKTLLAFVDESRYERLMPFLKATFAIEEKK